MDDRQEFEVRTDLALEVRESFKGDGGEIKGVILEKHWDEESGAKITRVVIENRAGSQAMGKPEGTYITLEAEELIEEEKEGSEKIAGCLARCLSELVNETGRKKKAGNVLAVGLGNQEVTSDSLGPLVIGELKINNHLTDSKETGWKLSAIVPGVMAQTGMETAQIVKGIVKETNPALVIVIDALAARSPARLGRTIQLTNTGIQPGSGVGNHRCSLTRETLGVPVIALGVPTVVGAASIVYDTMDSLMRLMASDENLRAAAEVFGSMEEQERLELIRELLGPRFGSMFVTPKDIDAVVKSLGQTISRGINLALRA